MPHGTPDWGLVGPISVLYGLDDMGEQAVRVGAVSSWDRIGHVVFSDNFSEGLGAWRSEVSSADGIVGLYTGESMSPPFCVNMLNGSGGATYARMRHYCGYEYRGHCGLELNIAYGVAIEWIKFGFYSSLATGRWVFYVRLTPVTGDLAYGSDVVGWTTFANLGALTANIWQWHNVKLVADFITGFFVRLTWEGTPIDMSAIAGIPRPALATYYWTALIENDSSDATQYYLHVDDVIMTIDQP